MIPVEFIDYGKCHEYARALGGEFGIPRSDWDDIGSDAYLLAIRRSWRTGESGNVEATANRLMYTSVLDVIRRRNTRANRMIRQADDIDAINSDSSDAALTLRSEDDEAVDTEPIDGRLPVAVGGELRSPRCDDDWQNPLWLRLFRYNRSQLRGCSRTIVRLLMKDSRLPLARAALGLSRPTFLKKILKLRTHFDQCFQALRAWRGQF